MRISLIIILIAMRSIAFSQVGGDHTYEFLNLNNSARVVSLGGNTIAIDDGDLNLSFHNPALLNKEMETQLLLNYVNYFADINYGFASYSVPNKSDYAFAVGLNYLDYGTFQESDEMGKQLGNFGAAEYALNLMASRTIDTNFRMGANFKPVFSSLYEYQSFGLAFDIGAVYTDSSGLFTAGVVFRNIGFQITPYHPGNYESLPFEIQLGASYKLEYAPFRFTLVLDHLESPDLTYEDPDYNLGSYGYNQVTAETNSTMGILSDKIMRHVIFGVEITPLDNFYVRFGYNYRRRQELKIDSRISTVGFSWGFGIKLYKFYLNYGRGTYHLAGATNHFSVRTDLNKLFTW